MRRGDIYLVSLDPTEGREQRGSRPSSLYRLPNLMRQPSCRWSARSLVGVTLLVASALLSLSWASKQPASFAAISPAVLDLGARNARKVDTLPASIMEEVLAKLVPIFE